MQSTLVLAGLLLLTVGIFIHYPPLSAVVLGSLLLAGGLTSHFLTRNSK